jgi:hypothetical protein
MEAIGAAAIDTLCVQPVEDGLTPVEADRRPEQLEDLSPLAKSQWPEGAVIDTSSPARCLRARAELAANPYRGWRHPRLLLHLLRCRGCRRFLRQVKEQRAEIVDALSGAPSAELRSATLERVEELRSRRHFEGQS